MNARRRFLHLALAASVGVTLSACSFGKKDEELPDPVMPSSSSSAPGTDTGATGGPSSGAGVGSGDPMLGSTEGVQRPPLDQIPDDQLDPSNATELAEHFRRIFQDEALDTDTWRAGLTPLSDPTFAASLPLADRGYFSQTAADGLTVIQPYKLGDDAPYAQIVATTQGSDLWMMTLAYTPSSADASVGTWKVISVDWADPEFVGRRSIPLNQDGRASLLRTASYGTDPVLTQKVGETPADREAALRTTMIDPTTAIARGKPAGPDSNETTQPGPVTTRIFVTPEGSTSVWVQSDTSYVSVAPDGTLGNKVPVTLIAELVIDDGAFVVKDAYSPEQFTEITGRAL